MWLFNLTSAQQCNQDLADSKRFEVIADAYGKASLPSIVAWKGEAAFQRQTLIAQVFGSSYKRVYSVS